MDKEESVISSSHLSDESMDSDSELSAQKDKNFLSPNQNESARHQQHDDEEMKDERMEEYSDSETSEVKDQTYEPTLPFSTEFSEEENESEDQSEPEMQVDAMQNQLDTIESHFINMPTLIPTADASIQTTDQTFTTVYTAQTVSTSTNTNTTP